MEIAHAFDSIVDELYLANVDFSAKRRLPSSLAAHFGCSSAVLWGFDSTTGQPWGEMISTHAPETIELYAAHYHRLDPFREPMLQRDPGTPVVGSTVIADASLARSAFYNDFGHKIETFHLMGALMPLGGPQGQYIAALSLHRPRNGQPFDAEEARWLRRIMPHVRRSNQLRTVMEPAQTAFLSSTIESVLEAIPQPAFLCDWQGRVIQANARAEATDREGLLSLRARGHDDKIALPDATLTLRLLDRIADAAMGGAGGIVRIGQGAFATVAPLTKGMGNFLNMRGGCALVIVKPGATDPAEFVQRMQALFDMTTAEANVAFALTTGASPDQIAAARGVRISTVRTLLERAVSKTGARNLRQFVALLATLGTA